MDMQDAQSTVTTVEFLDWLFGSTRDDQIAVSAFVPYKNTRTFFTTADSAMYAQELDDNGAEGVYFRLSTLPADWKPVRPGARGDASESAWSYAIMADLDLRGPGHVSTRYPETDLDLTKLLEKAGLPEPSAWINSGGGRYPVWKLSERVPAGEMAALSAAWHAHLITWAEVLGWKVDNTSDVARVYRMPGTHNRKRAWGDDPPVCSVTMLTEITYTFSLLSDILAAASAAPPEQSEQPSNAPASSQLFAQPGRLAEVDPLKPRTYTDASAGAYLAEQEMELEKKLWVGNVYRAMSGFLLQMLHFEQQFPWLTRNLMVERIEAAARKIGWEALDPDDTEKIHRTFRKWDAGLVDDMWVAVRIATAPSAPEKQTRRVDLRKYLDGTYEPPQPAVGLERSDGKLMLYPGRWHTVIGPNGTGKSFLALAHCIAEMRKGNVVVYAHFEEPDPGGTLYRLRAMAPDLTVEVIEALFVWLDCASSWTLAEWTQDIEDARPALTVLDGINDASTRQGWDPSDIMAPGNYADLFVTPARVCGSAVFSLGHPPKAKGRETERHGFGSTAWLDKLEGVGFRLLPSKKPIRDEHHGYAMLYTVKDRYGQVQKGLEPAQEKDMDGWYVVGAFWVDSEKAGLSTYGIKPPETNEEGGRKDVLDVLGESIVLALKNGTAQTWGFDSLRQLTTILREAEVTFKNDDLEPAVERLHRRGRLDSPSVGPRRSRRGTLSLLETAPDEGLVD